MFSYVFHVGAHWTCFASVKISLFSYMYSWTFWLLNIYFLISDAAGFFINVCVICKPILFFTQVSIQNIRSTAKDLASCPSQFRTVWISPLRKSQLMELTTRLGLYLEVPQWIRGTRWYKIIHFFISIILLFSIIIVK